MQKVIGSCEHFWSDSLGDQLGDQPYDSSRTCRRSSLNVAITPDGTRAYVAGAGANSVTVIDTVTNTVLTNLRVGAIPVDISISPDNETRTIWARLPVLPIYTFYSGDNPDRDKVLKEPAKPRGSPPARRVASRRVAWQRHDGPYSSSAIAGFDLQLSADLAQAFAHAGDADADGYTHLLVA